MNIFHLTLAGLFFFLLVGCSSKPPEETSVYLLRAAPVELKPGSTGGRKIGLGQVRVAEYLNQDGIVLELAQNRINHARYHVWAEPLSNSIKSILITELARQLAQPVEGYSSFEGWDYRVDVFIDQFHGTSDGRVKFAASWLVTRAGADASSQNRWQYVDRLSASGYDALVSTHKDILEELAAQIAGTLGPVEPSVSQ